MLKNTINDHLAGDVNAKTDLCNLYERYGSDKSTYHNYSALYAKLFEEFKDMNINFLEVGLGTNNLDVKSNMGRNGKPGASLFTISEMFPKWNVYGLDVDKRILFQDESKRIKTFFVDQTDKDTIRSLCLNEFRGIEFHIIIDDGLHELHANQLFFENTFHLLSEGGYFIIEDILDPDEFKKYFDSIGIEYSLFSIPHPKNKVDNTLFIIRKEIK
jgi:SAM-dependent methyltransferase